MKTLTNVADRLIKKAEIELKNWDNTSWFKRFYTQDSISKAIGKFERKIDVVLESFNVRNLLHHLLDGKYIFFYRLIRGYRVNLCLKRYTHMSLTTKR